MVNIAGSINLFIAEPEVVQDVILSKNAHLDKSDDLFASTRVLMGNPLFLSSNDDQWKAKRRACAHAFYKDRIEHMLDVLRVQLGKR